MTHPEVGALTALALLVEGAQVRLRGDPERQPALIWTLLPTIQE
jgi:hypothetical protein